MYIHLVAGRRDDLTLYTTVDHLAGLAGLVGYESRIDLTDSTLLGSEAAANTGLLHADAGFWDSECVGDNAAYMVYDLRGAYDIQSAVGIHVAAGAEGLHHGLLIRLRVVDMVDDDIAVGENRLHIAVGSCLAGTAVRLVIRTDEVERFPIVFRVNQNI